MSDYQPKKSPSQWISIQEATRHAPYSQEYLSLLARRGKIFAKKIGRNWYTTHEALERYISEQALLSPISKQFSSKVELASAPSSSNLMEEFKRLNPQVFGQDTKQKVGTKTPEPVVIPPVVAPVIPEVNSNNSVLQKLDRLSDSLETFASSVTQAIPNIIQANQPAPLDPEVEEFIQERNSSKIHHFKHFNRFSKSTTRSPVGMVTIAITAVVLLFILVGGFSFGQVDAITQKIKKAFTDANSIQGHFAGTHANEVLILDKAGNVNIFGHIETQGQFRSYAPDGVAPIVVDSMTKVDNLNADYIDNLSSQDFSLAFVTKNGNLTYEDVNLEGNVEVGKTLTVKGATKLMDSLQVYGKLGVFSDATFGKNVTLTGGDLTIQKGNLSLTSGTLVINNQSLVKNLNAEFLDGVKKGDINLNFVTSNGNSTSNAITVGGLNVNGTSNFNGVGFFNNGIWGSTGSFGTLGVNGSTGIGDKNNLSKTTFTVYSNKFSLDTNGNATFGGNVGIGGSTTMGDLLVHGSVLSSLIPSGSFDLGSGTNPWGNVYAGNLIVSGNANFPGTTSSSFVINMDNVSSDSESSYLTFNRGLISPDAKLTWDSTLKQFSFNEPVNVASGSFTVAVGPVGIGTTAPVDSALLDLNSTTRGFLAPRMTQVQRDAISAPASGLLIFNTDTTTYNAYNGLTWLPVGALKTREGTTNVQLNSNTLTFSASDFNVTASGSTDTLVSIDYINGPASRSIDQIITGHWTFANGASVSTNFEVGGYASIGGNLFLRGDLSFNGTDHTGLRLNNLTTTQRDLISASAGQTIFNTSVTKMQVYNGTVWKNVGNPEIGAEVTAGTAGSVLFVDGAGNLGQDNNNFYWDVANRRLGLGTKTPTTVLEVQGTASASYGLFGTLQIGGFASASYNRFGTGISTNGLSSSNDLLVSGLFENIGNAFFRSNASVSTNFEVGGYASIGGNTTIKGTLGVTGDTTLTGTLVGLSVGSNSFAGSLNLNLGLHATGNSTTLAQFISSGVGSNSFAGSLDITKGLRASQITGTGLTINGNGNFTGNVGIGTDLIVTGQSQFSNASATFGFESNYLKTDTISNSTGTLQINAFTLGGLVTGNNQNILGLNQLTANIASISTNFEVGGYASIGGNTTIAGTLGVTGNTTLTGILTSNSTGSNSFAGSLDITKGLRASNFTQVGTSTNYFNGNVGIGTTGPTTKFQVVGAASVSTNFEVGGYASIGGNTTIAGMLGVTGNTTLTGTLSGLSVGSNYFLGSLAIGKATPNATLDVHGTASASYFFGGSNGGLAGTPVFTFANDTNTGMFNPSADALAFSTNGTEHFRIDNNGNFGIGTKNLETNFELVGTASISGNLIVGGFTQVNGNTSSSFEGPLTLHGIPLGTGINQGTLYINPSTSGPNNLLFGAAVGGVEQLRLDASGNLKIVGVFNSTNASGTNQLSGNLLVQGNTTIGGTASNSVSFVARINTDVLPTVDNQFNLGSATKRWASIYADNAHFSSNTSLPGVASASFTIFTSNITNDASSSYLAFHRGTATPDARLMWDAVNKDFNFNFPVYLLNNLIVAGTATSSFAGPAWFTAVPTGAGVQNGALYVNPAGAAVDTTIFGVAVNNISKFKVDAEGDTFVYGDATITNGQTIQGATGLVLSGTNAPLTFTNTGNHDLTASGGTLRIGAFTLLGAITGGGNAITGLGQLGVANASASGNFEANNSLIANNTLQVGGLSASASYNRFGTAISAHGLSANTDVFISGKMEVQGNTYFTGTVNFSGIASASAFYAHSGTSASPSFSFGIDENTGIFRKTADSLSISTGGAERLNLTNTTASISNTLYLTGGNVGIGTSAPSATLNVSGTAQIGTAAWPIATFTQNGSKFLITDVNTPALIINNAYNTISANSGAEIYLGARGTTSTNDSAYVRIAGARENAVSGNFATYFNIKTMNGAGNEIQALRIDSTGNIGIGTTVPSTLLNLYASQASKTTLGDSRQLILENSDRTLNDRLEIGLGYKTGATYQPVVLGTIMTSASAFSKGDFYIATRDVTTDTAPTTRFLITSGGNVGINSGGTVDTQFEVGGTASIGGNITTTGTLVSSNTGSNSFAGSLDIAKGLRVGANTAFSVNANASANTLVVVGGNVGIGTTNPGAKLVVLPTATITSLGALSHSDLVLYTKGGSSEYAQIGFGGYGETASYVPASIGYLTMNAGAHGYGDIVFATRNVTTDTQPTERMRIDNAGNVGIGTTAPGAKLAVEGVSNAAQLDLIRLENTGSGIGTGAGIGFGVVTGQTVSPAFIAGTYLDGTNGMGLQFGVGGGAALANAKGSVAVTILGNGNVGIGTTGPSDKLNVVAAKNSITIPSAGGLMIDDSSALGAGVGGALIFRGIYSGTSQTFAAAIHAAKTNANSGDYSFDLAFNTRINGGDNVERMRIQGSTGNVGIGTTAPGAKLDIQTAGNALRLSADASNYTTFYSNGNLTITPTAGTVIFASDISVNTGHTITFSGVGYIRNSTGVLNLNDNNTNNVIIAGGGGNVGIGTTAPAGKLDIVGNLTGNTGALFRVASTSELFRVQENGNVGIGTTAPGALLQINGAATSTLLKALGTGTDAMTFDVNSGTANLNVIGSTGDILLQATATRGIVGTTSNNRLDLFANNAAVMTLSTTGNVGIGTTAPAGKLDIVGDLTGNTGALFRVASTSELFRVQENGNVGINSGGTIDTKFEVGGTASISGATTLGSTLAVAGNTTLTGTLTGNSVGSNSFAGSVNTTLGLHAGGNSTTTAQFISSGLGSNSFAGSLELTAGLHQTGPSSNYFTGNVGIGTTAPNQLLEVVGAGSPTIKVRSTTNNGGQLILSSSLADWTTYIQNTDYRIYDGAVGGGDRFTIMGGTGSVGIGSTAPVARLDVVGDLNYPNVALFRVASSSGIAALYLTKGGNLGIGTSVPVFKLDVVGDVNIPTGSQYKINGVDQAFDKWSAGAGNDIYRQNGNVGIGTTAPGTPLSVLGANQLMTLGLGTATLNSNDSMAINKGGSLALGGSYTGTSATTFAGIAGLKENSTDSNVAGYLAFYTRAAGVAPAENMRITSTGNVGIGTTGPGAKLNVVDVNQIIDSGGTLLVQSSGAQAIDKGGQITLGGGYTDAGAVQFFGSISGRKADAVSGNLNGYLALATAINGTQLERMRITSGGNVGIGTTGPTQKLQVVSTANNEPMTLGAVPSGDFAVVSPNSLYGLWTGVRSTGDAWMQVGRTDSATAYNLLLQPKGGNVGIGTTGPGSKLTVGGQTANTPGIVLRETDDGNDAIRLISNTAYGYLDVMSAGTSVVRLNGGGDSYFNVSGGNVGIGTTVPRKLLQVQLADATTAHFGNTNYALNNYSGISLGFMSTDGYYEKSAIVQAGTGDANARGKIMFLNNNTADNSSATLADARMTIQADGNVGIGTTAPATKLTVLGTGNNTPSPSNTTSSNGVTRFLSSDGIYLDIGMSKGSPIWSTWLQAGDTGAANNYPILLNPNGGNVGIGTTNPSSDTLQVTGSAGKTVGGTSWDNLSDVRLKNILGNLNGTALDTLSQLRPIKYQWNNLHQQLYGGSTDNLMYGFAAQEIMQVIPQFVHQSPDGYYWYNPSGFEAILTAGVQS